MKYALTLLQALLLGACVSHTQPDPASQDSLAGADSTVKKNAFFPVADFLESEILSVDSTPLLLKKIVTRNGHRDTTLITAPEFNVLALQFLPPELRDNGLDKNFTESSFADKTTQSITFTYSPINKDGPLQRVDVLTIPGVRAQEVKSIYLERSHTAGDSAILQKMYWRSKKSFQIVTTTRVRSSPPAEEQLQVVWNEDVDE
jgi:hypothetical protein